MQGTAAISEDTDYQIEKSLRFNSGDSSYLGKSKPGAGNQRVGTVSFLAPSLALLTWSRTIYSW